MAADREAGSTAAKAQAGELSAVLLLGNAAWPATGNARKIVVTSGAVEADDTVDVVLPVAHPYERPARSPTSKGGSRRSSRAACRRSGVPSDWLLLAGLIDKLGGSAPRELKAIRAAMAEAHPSYKLPEGRTGRVGRLALPLA